MQRVEIIGRVGRDAEVKDFNNNQVINFSVCVTEKHQDKEYTTWYDVAKWGNNVSVAPHIKKGIQVFIAGKPTVRAYISSQSNEAVGVLGINAFEIQLLSFANDNQQGQSAPAQQQQSAAYTNIPSSNNEEHDDLPF